MRISETPRMMRLFKSMMLCAVLLANASWARAHEFPTKDIVDYVEVCMRDDKSERLRQEKIYKCSCVMDQLMKQYDFDKFVEGITASRAFGIAGERGSVIRDSQEVQALASAFRKAEKSARKQCFLDP